MSIKSLWRSARADFEKVGLGTKIITTAGAVIGATDFSLAVLDVVSGKYRDAAVNAGMGVGAVVVNRLHLRLWAWYASRSQRSMHLTS